MNFLFPYMARWKAVNWTRYHQLYTRLAKMGHNVYVLQPQASSNLTETNYQEIQVALPETLRLVDIEVPDFIWGRKFPLNKLLKKGFYTLYSKNRIAQMVRDQKINVMMTYNIPQYPLLDACKCFKIFDYADDYRAMLAHELGRLSNNTILNFADHLLERMIKKSDMTLAVSNVLADKIRHTKARIEVVPNGADMDDFRIDPNVKIGGDYKKPVAGFLGSFEYFIDFDLIISTAQKLPGITFLLVGSGRDFEYVKREVKIKGLNNVVLTGAVAHSEIAYYIDKMDICLNVFKKTAVSHGACPLKLFEYLIMNKPVISSRLHEIEKINRDFIFYADTADEMVETINALLRDETKAREYAQRGYEITLNEYTWQSIVANFLNLLSKNI